MVVVREGANMHRARMGERIMVETVATGESHLGEVQALEDGAIRVAVTRSRDTDLPAPGTPVRITFVRRDGLYEEQGTVAELVEAPAAELRVELTGEVVRTNRRDFVRRDASLNVVVEAGSARARCVTKDVSGGGVSLLLYELPPFVEGQEFEISMNLPDGRLPIRARCKTKYVRETLRGSRWLAGSQFVQISDDDRQRIVRFVFRLELAQKRR